MKTLQDRKYCACNHPVDEKGSRIFQAGAYVENGIWYCGRCHKIIPMTNEQKYFAEEEKKHWNT